ncbi:probable ubiquitin carboxyl-terminal hydrolase MINDY-4 [Branchiostoma lanceolatum]|uniref:probable ubiquitin carboxyl-terminal hydrolase MINDY-4 n=1 Tax=Branchiostoma lanceolatum TaxID=7740 RepID=UPI0034539EC5
MQRRDNLSNGPALSSGPPETAQQKNGLFPPIVQRKEGLSNSTAPSSRQKEIVRQENGSTNRTVSSPIAIVKRKEVLSNSPLPSPRQKEIVPQKNSFSKSPAVSSPRVIVQRKSISTDSPASSPIPRQREVAQRKTSLPESPVTSPRQREIVQRKSSLSDSPAPSPRQKVIAQQKNILTNSLVSPPRQQEIGQQKNNFSDSPVSSPRQRSYSDTPVTSPRQKAIAQQKHLLSDSPLASPRQSDKATSSPRAIAGLKEILSNSPASSPRQQQKYASSYRTGSSPRAIVQQKVSSNSPALSPRQKVIVGQKNVLSNSPASSPSQGGYFPELREGYKEAAGIVKNLEEDMANSQELSRKDSGFSSVSSAESEEEAALKAKEMEKAQENLKELSKLAKLFDKQGLEFTDAQPKKVENPSQVEVPLLVQLKMQREEEEVMRMEDGAMPITLETALALRKLLFGTGNYAFNIEWKRTRFTFRDVKSNFPYGLFMEKHGSRGMTMCVQAYILKHLLYRDGCLLEEKGNSNNLLVERFNMGFFEDQREDALLHALADILWKAGERKYAAVTIVGEKMCITPSPELRFDSYTEKILIYEFTEFEALLKFLRRNIDQNSLEKGS